MKKRTTQKTSLFNKYRTNPLMGISILLIMTIIVLGVFMQVSMITTRLFLTDTNNQVIASNEDAAAIPTFLRIPHLEISLVINQTGNSNQKGSGVFHLTTTNEKSKSIIIYGQNTPYHFGRLAEIQKGEKIFLVTQDGILHTYIVEKKFTGSLSELSKSTENALYLTTQFGFAIQKRLVIKATPLH